MEKCRWCGNAHGPLCPAVKSIEYDETGLIVRRVEFFAPNDYAPKLSPGGWPPNWPITWNPAAIDDRCCDPRFTAAAAAYFGGVAGRAS